MFNSTLKKNNYGYSLKNEPMNVKIGPLIRRSIMGIINEVEPPLSNSPEILGRWMFTTFENVSRKKLMTWER